jgi:hypothetical protein
MPPSGAVFPAKPKIDLCRQEMSRLLQDLDLVHSTERHGRASEAKVHELLARIEAEHQSVTGDLEYRHGATLRLGGRELGR